MRIEDAKNLWEYFEEIKNAPVVLELIWSVKNDVFKVLEKKELSIETKEEVKSMLGENAESIALIILKMEEFRAKNEKFYEDDNYYKLFRTLLALEDIEEKLKFFATDTFSKDNILSLKIRLLENVENISFYKIQDKTIENFIKKVWIFAKNLA